MQRRTIALLVVVSVLATYGCTRGGTSVDPAARDPWTEEAQAYGLGPLPNNDVTFQPDVVIVSGGGRSIRSVSDGGLTWHIDGKANGADELEVGKVMFVTGRSVGRVLALARNGDDLRVTIGPVTLTEVIRDGTFNMTGIALNRPVEYPAVEPNWETYGEAAGVLDAAAEPASKPTRLQPASFFARSGPTATPRCCASGIGVDFNYNEGGTKLLGSVELTFAKPTAGFYLEIDHGKLVRAALNVSGGFGTRINFEAGTSGGPRDRPVTFPVDGDWAFPMGQILGVPLTLTVSQGLTITPAFGTLLGTIRGNGAFSLAGSLGYGYSEGTFGPQISRHFQRQSSLINSLSGAPVGVMGLLVEHRVKFNLGFSAFVLKAGVYMDLATRIGVTRGSALGALGYVMCQGAGLGLWAHFGVGFSILQPVVRAINWFLSLIDIKPIPEQAGLRSKPVKIYANEDVTPDVQLCGHTPGQ